MKKHCLAALLLAAVSCSPQDGEYQFHILSTNDVHGAWFDSTYVGDRVKPSLLSAEYYIDSVRNEAGKENVILIDAGDCLQGDNAAYYYNYIDTASPHLFSRIVKYIGYDAVTVGNHDIETGPAVYDRVNAELSSYGIPFLASNAVVNEGKNAGKSYFRDYVILKRQGFRIAITGFTNPNIKEWLGEDKWKGMDFTSLIPSVQEKVDEIKRKERPDIVIVSIHSGAGKGDGSQLENQGLDLFESLSGVDFLLCSHDHRPLVETSDKMCLINSGSHARNIGEGIITVTVKKGRITEKKFSAGLIKVKAGKVGKTAGDEFRKDYDAVKAFTNRRVGSIDKEILTRDAYFGQSDYLNLIHSVCLESSGADISFAAPLTFNGRISAGELVYHDLFTIYPYENQLFTIELTGREIRRYLEESYNLWVNSLPSPHALKIEFRNDPRNNKSGWSFVNRSYNFDSAGGLDYEVNLTEKYPARIRIISMADGNPFDENAKYSVAMTSYRANGGGDLLEMAGVRNPEITGRYAEIRDLLYEYISGKDSLKAAGFGNPSVAGSWKFTPKKAVSAVLEADRALLFRD